MGSFWGQHGGSRAPEYLPELGMHALGWPFFNFQNSKVMLFVATTSWHEIPISWTTTVSWGFLVFPGVSCGYMGPYGAIWGHMGVSGAIWGHLGPSTAILGPSGAIWSHMESYGTIWGHLGTYIMPSRTQSTVIHCSFSRAPSARAKIRVSHSCASQVAKAVMISCKKRKIASSLCEIQIVQKPWNKIHSRNLQRTKLWTPLDVTFFWPDGTQQTLPLVYAASGQNRDVLCAVRLQTLATVD